MISSFFQYKRSGYKEKLYLYNNQAKFIYFVDSGRIIMYDKIKKPEGNLVIPLKYFGPGEFFGYDDINDPQYMQHNFNAMGITNKNILFRISYKRFLTFFDQVDRKHYYNSLKIIKQNLMELRQQQLKEKLKNKNSISEIMDDDDEDNR